MSDVWTWIKDTWNKFEGWVATWMPGFKTYVINGLGAIGSLAVVLQQYITGLPLSEFMDGTQIAIATGVLFTLGFWFHNMSERQALPIAEAKLASDA